MRSSGSIRPYKGRSDHFIIRFDAGEDGEGNRQRKKVYFHGSLTEAKKELTRLKAEVDKGTYADPGKIKLGEYLDQWLANYHAAKKLAPKTYQSYKMIIEKHLKPELGKILLKKLTPKHIQDYYTKATTDGRQDKKKTKGGSLSSNTVLHHHRLLNLAMKRAFKEGLIPYNMVERVDCKRQYKTYQKR